MFAGYTGERTTTMLPAGHWSSGLWCGGRGGGGRPVVATAFMPSVCVLYEHTAVEWCGGGDGCEVVETSCPSGDLSLFFLHLTVPQ